MLKTVNTHHKAHGQVYLIGAGPGDPELLTIKATKAIAAATVLMVDDLVNPAVLDYAKQSARKIYVGKRGGCISTPQALIEKIMIREAKAGHVVARIKGGDPYIFGRGGEELTTLQTAGVRCEVINGITSGLAAASSVAVPLTHRKHTPGVIFVTGHEQQNTSNTNYPLNDTSALHSRNTNHTVNWAALAATGMTLVIYMGISRAADIQDRLLAAGLPANTPAAVIQNATHVADVADVDFRQHNTSDTAHRFMTLSTLSKTILEQGLKSPSIIVIGSVVQFGIDAALRESAAPSSNKPQLKAA